MQRNLNLCVRVISQWLHHWWLKFSFYCEKPWDLEQQNSMRTSWEYFLLFEKYRVQSYQRSDRRAPSSVCTWLRCIDETVLVFQSVIWEQEHFIRALIHWNECILSRHPFTRTYTEWICGEQQVKILGDSLAFKQGRPWKIGTYGVCLKKINEWFSAECGVLDVYNYQWQEFASITAFGGWIFNCVSAWSGYCSGNEIFKNIIKKHSTSK
jgi:hypothetical protein